MIEIKKGREPACLMAYRKTKFASYDGMDKDVHEAVLNSLMRDQGYICAYCMRRILPQNEREENQKKRKYLATIEHIDPQSKTDDAKALDYRNMLAVCHGNRGCGNLKNMTCDARRQNTDLIVNPLDANTLHSIEYKHDGRIFSRDERVNKDLDETLNLNCPQIGLAASRLSALHEMQRGLSKRKQDGDIKLQCQRLLDFYNHQTTKTPYVGILIWWLQKKIES